MKQVWSYLFVEIQRKCKPTTVQMQTNRGSSIITVLTLSVSYIRIFYSSLKKFNYAILF